MTNLHQIILSGPAVSDERISGHLFRDLMDVLVDGAERALRYRIEGRSTAGGGPYPKYLRAAADFALLRKPELGANSAVIEARPLVETMPDRFVQGEMFADLDPSRSPIDLFEDALEDALAGNEDSDRFDAGLVKSFENFGALLDQGVENVDLINGRHLQVNEKTLKKVHHLASRSYAPQRVRVAGQLETIRYSDCRFVLKLEDKTLLPGTAIDLGNEVLRAFYGKPVLVTGKATFRPSGRPLQIEAEDIENVSEHDAVIWSRPPKPLLGPARPVRDEQRGKKGLAALLGKWPGDETDEEVQAALDSLS